jgi:hypothetical protein
MMRLVKNKQVDLIYPDERMHKTLVQHFCRAYNDHILREMISPGLFIPKVGAHRPAESTNRLVDIMLENCALLENKGHTVYLY